VTAAPHRGSQANQKRNKFPEGRAFHPNPIPPSSIMPTESTSTDLGKEAPDFSLPGTDNTTYTLHSVRGKSGLLVIFMCNHCPYVRAILPHIIRDANDLKSLGIGVAAISSNDATAYPDDSFENMKTLAQQWRFPFPYLHDESQAVARAYGAVCTPEFYGFDASLKLRYRGRLDASRKDLLPDARRELFEAMREIANTGTAPKDQHPALGCSIKWKTN
jgi:peroxiredoxin